MQPNLNVSPKELQIQNQRMKDTISSLLDSNGFKTIEFKDVRVGFNVIVNGVEIFHIYTNTNYIEQIFRFTSHDSGNTTIMNIDRIDDDYSRSILHFRQVGHRGKDLSEFYHRYSNISNLEQYVLAQINGL